MNYTHEIKKLPKSEVELTVTILHDDLKPFLNKAAKQFSEQMEIKGFRKGKAPLDVIKKEIGEMKLYEEAAALAVEKSYIEIATKEKLEPIGSPKVDFQKLVPGNDFTYKATVALVPETKLGDWKKIKVKEKTTEIKEEEITKTLNTLQEQRATEVLEDKKIEMGDKVEIDFDAFLDKVPIEHGSEKKYPLIVGKNLFIPGFEEKLVGLKKDETTEFELTFPQKYHNASLAGKPTKFKVKVLSVFKRTLPELNDEFAKSLGVESLAKLKEEIKKNIEHEQFHKAEEELEGQVIEKIIEGSEFGEIPDTLVTAETNKMLQEMQNNLAQQGLKYEDYLKHLNKTPDQLKLEFVPQAMKRLKAALVSRTIFFEEEIAITDEAVNRETEKMKTMYQSNPEMVKKLDSPEYKDYVRNMIGNQKTMDLIKKTCIERDESKPKVECNH